jgi:hypothetical protein
MGGEGGVRGGGEGGGRSLEGTRKRRERMKEMEEGARVR